MSTSFRGASSPGGHTGLRPGLAEPMRREQLVYNQISRLTCSFDTFLKLYEKPPVTKEQIGTVLKRLDRLNLGKKDGDAADEQESARRDVLLTALNRIENKLREVSDRTGTAGHTVNEDSRIVSELVDDIRDAVIEYQAAQQQAMYDQNLKHIKEAELSVLNGCRRAHGAGYRHGNRNGCLKGTRESVLNEIERWTEDFGKSPIFWLNGLAGTGKTTIAQTLAERVFADGRLGASFFCSRGFEDRSDLQFIFPTLAFQLAQKYPGFRSSLLPLLRSNPDVVHESLQEQMQKFLVDPLHSADISTVIVIDALDECKDEDPESAILLVLGQSVSRIPQVKFFITSRPEAHIMWGFRAPLLKELTDVFILHEVERCTIDNDIRHFLKHQLSGLSHRHRGMAGLPTDEQLDSLCRRAAGFFVYAVATVNFLKHKFRRPSDRLDVIMKSPESTVYEGKAELKAYTSLDSLYTSIFQEAFCRNDAEDDVMVRSVLSAVVLVTNPLPPSAIATLTGFECDEVIFLLESIQSLLALHEDTSHPIQPFHKSFPDFITDPARCCDPRFYISPDHHIELVLHCLGLMEKLLEKNICSIPDYALNSEVEDLLKRIEESGIRGALEYACRSWYKHLIVSEHRTAEVVASLHDFLEGKFIFWLEVLSVIDAVGDAARALNATAQWLYEVQKPIDVDRLIDTTTDCLRFVTEFFEVISLSAPHIYHSALLLVPHSSMVRKLYHEQICSRAPRVVTGIPTSWDSCTASAAVRVEADARAVWSPCGQRIAVSLVNGKEIRDLNTLERISVLNYPSGYTEFTPKLLAFSPDGRQLACTSHHVRISTLPGSNREERTSLFFIFVWDIQTGVITKEFKIGRLGEITFSQDQRTITVVMENDFCTYDGLEGTLLREGELLPASNYQLGPHWAHGGSLQFATFFRNGQKLVIEIRELQPTPDPQFLVVESFPRTYHKEHPYRGRFSFSPVSFHASFVTQAQVVILDVRDSRILLHVKSAQPLYRPPGCFSPDGCFFACSTLEKSEIYVWKNAPDGYASWSILKSRLPFNEFSFSPNATSILTWCPGGIQLLRIEERISAPSLDRTEPLRQDGQHLVAYSMDRKYISTVRRFGSVVTILDHSSGIWQQSTDMNMRVRDIKIANNTIFATDGCELVRWHTETGEMTRSTYRTTREETAKVQAQAGEEPLALSSDGSQLVLCSGRKALLYDIKTQEFDEYTAFATVADVRFSPDGQQLWLLANNVVLGEYPSGRTFPSYCLATLEVTENRHLGNVAKRYLWDDWPWVDHFSPHGYHIGRDSGWVSDPRGNKLLWLPPSWRAKQRSDVRWDGDFLAFVGNHHPQPIVIEFKP